MKNFSWVILFFYFGIGTAQQIDTVDFIRISAEVQPNTETKSLKGNLKVEFKILKPTDSIYLDAKNIEVTPNASRGSEVITTSEDKIWIFSKNFKVGKSYVYSFNYSAKPKQTLYFMGDEIWTQGQGKYTSHWLPSIDDMNDKIEFDLTIISDSDKTAIANGKLTDVTIEGTKKFWYYNMVQPMSSYLVAFAIGNFQKKELVSNSGILIELYLKPKDSLKFEPTYRYTKEIFDFFENEIGFPYPWQNYKQLPVRDFLYAGMENTTATIFSEAFVVDSIGFNDRNYVNVNAHELAHQWFGDLVTETSSENHWLHEGFATYYALLAEKKVFGDDYFYHKLYQSAEQLKQISDSGKGESLDNAKASSLTFYEKGAWALHILRETIGDEAFKNAVKNYLTKYQFKNVTTKNFMDEVKAVSEVDVSKFETNWLKQTAFQSEDAYQSLKKSTFMNGYFEIMALRNIPFETKKKKLEIALKNPNDFVGQEVISQLASETSIERLPLFEIALKSNNLYVRQAVALGLNPIPASLQTEFESLLNDKSYLTNEFALYALWQQFPKKRKDYLEKTKAFVGFQDKNIRQLWLALALVTEDFHPEKKTEYLNELSSYTSSKYSFEIRDKAFQYISEINLWNTETLKNLAEATVHINWRFRNSSRELLMQVLKDERFKKILVLEKVNISEEANAYLSKTLE